MYIKSVTIDGFKSYAQRTEVSGFDPQFNAITGLNGSGKSNILDAICFLLGITNLSQVRATNLQDLVYKSGQAGVQKATVSIIFDNTNKNDSPYGYEQFEELTITRQVVIGGKNRYLINGNNATNTRVQDLFRSVQLNVNNPHFLIMQGRITKVLNMKPPEILSLLEEAASTKLYEHKKEAALKTIEKKDNKLHEIETLLREEITPTLSRLRQERSSYLEYQKVTRELEHLTKIWIAYQFTICQETCAKTGQSLSDMQQERERLIQHIKTLEEERQTMEQEITALHHERDTLQSDEMVRLENEFNEAKKADVLVLSAVSRAKDHLKQEQKKLQEITKHSRDAEKTMENKKNAMEKLRNGFEKLHEEAQRDSAAVEAAQKHLQAVNSGLMSNEDGEAATLEEQLRAAKEESSNAEIEARQAEMRLKLLSQEVRTKESELSRTNSDFAREEKLRKELHNTIASIEKELAKIPFSTERQEELQGEERKLRSDVNNLREQVDSMQARFPNLNFQYADPQRNFDRSRVKGLIAKLIKVKEAKFATALEVTAGGRLYNVVVDSEHTSKALIERGQLQRRITFIPLNKIEGSRIPPHVVNKARSVVGEGNVHTALSLIGYDGDLRSAMEYVFGQAFVCPDLDTAKTVTFHPDVQRRSVTLDGDQFDPQGTLSGGSRPHTSSLLTKLEELHNAETAFYEHETRLGEVRQELQRLSSFAERYRQVQNQLQRRRHELEMIEAQLSRTDYHQLKLEIEKMKEEMNELKAVTDTATQRRRKAVAKVASVEKLLANKAAVRERELKMAQEAVEKSKQRAAASAKRHTEQEATFDALKLEIAEFEKEIQGFIEQKETVKTAIANAEDDLQAKEEETKVSKDAMAEVKERLEKQRDLVKSKTKLINEKEYELKKRQKDQTQEELKVEDLAHKIQTQTKESKDAAKQLEAMLEQHPWIAEERKNFGKPNSTYDFAQKDPRDAQKRISRLQETKEKLSKTVNMRAMNMLGKAEEQYQELIDRRRIVLNDKQKMQSIIDELDKKKNEALMNVYREVNKAFGHVFGTLLPNSNAKLVPPEGKTVLDGLEFRVAFGDTWKETLSELSGGQRSLVALSLILALLRYKPAPLYILDEVDAALDLSHTQNIGQLIKQQFPQSQFVVVSLKDGMFNNANVLFKTKFVDGVSTVSRHVPRSATSTEDSRRRR